MAKNWLFPGNVETGVSTHVKLLQCRTKERGRRKAGCSAGQMLRPGQANLLVSKKNTEASENYKCEHVHPGSWEGRFEKVIGNKIYMF